MAATAGLVFGAKSSMLSSLHTFKGLAAGSDFNPIQRALQLLDCCCRRCAADIPKPDVGDMTEIVDSNKIHEPSSAPAVSLPE